MNKKILVVDDSLIVKKLIENALQDEYVVVKANNGKEATDLIVKDKDICAMLLDLNMPDYDGFYVLNYFKNNNIFKRIPVSIISGDDSKETIDRAFTYDIVDMLNKPFSMENIKSAVERAINLGKK